DGGGKGASESSVFRLLQQFDRGVNLPDRLQQCYQLRRRRYVFVTAPGGGRVHHVTPQFRVGQAKTSQACADRIHTEAIHQYVRRGVVAEHDHQGRVIQDRKRRR